MIYNYPNCPPYCEICKNYYGEMVCLKCRGDRIKLGSICKCEDPTMYDDGEENCIEKLKPAPGEIKDNLLLFANFRPEGSVFDNSHNYV